MEEICVVIDNQRYQPLLPVSDGASGRLPLTTMRQDQRAARVQVYRTGSRTPSALYTVDIEGIEGAKPELDVRGWIRAGVLHLEFDLQGTTINRKSIRLRRHSADRWWVLIPAVLVVASIVLLILPHKETPSAVGPSTSSRTEPSRPGLVPSEVSRHEQTGSPSSAPEQRSLQAPDDAGGASDTLAPGAAVSPNPAESATAAPGPSTEEDSPGVSESPVIGVAQSATVYFQPDVATLTGEARELLDGLLPGLRADIRWVFTGHCALAGTERGRRDLSVERAEAVYAYLLEKGWDPEEEPVVAGVGGAQPVTTDPARQYLNRRVEITPADE